jgi:hypothetical protein
MSDSLALTNEHDRATRPEDRPASPDSEGQRRGLLADRCIRRRWPIALAVGSLVLGMAYMLGWDAVVHNVDCWSTGGDLWDTFRGAHYVGWGFVGGIYAPGNGIASFPGMPVLLAPVAILSSSLHLTEEFPPFLVARPTAALLLQPVESLLTSTVVFATEALADRVGVGQARRRSLCVIVAVVAFPVGVVWGHAEDALAMTFAMYALIAMLDRKWSKCGWLLGFGIVMQPLVALMLPLMIGASPVGHRIAMAIRSVTLSIVLVGVALLGDAADTYRAVVQQPAFPAGNHPTPWLALAPRLAPVTARMGRASTLVDQRGHLVVESVASQVRNSVVVTGGLGRSLYLVVAVLLGVYVWRRPQSAVRLIWLAAAILAARCFFEAVMCPYYLAPPLFLALLMASRMSGRRFWAAVGLAVGVSVFAYFFLNPWLWWVPVVMGLGAVLALGYPNDLKSAADGVGSSSDSSNALGLRPDTVDLVTST